MQRKHTRWSPSVMDYLAIAGGLINLLVIAVLLVSWLTH